MLRAVNRLPKEEIPLILRYGTHRRNDAIELIYKKRRIPDQVGDDNKNARFAFIVSTKIDKRAVARNRMRRVMSESVRLHLEEAPQVDGVFIAKKNFSDILQTEVQKFVSDLLKI